MGDGNDAKSRCRVFRMREEHRNRFTKPGVSNTRRGVSNTTPGVSNTQPGVSNTTPGVPNTTRGSDFFSGWERNTMVEESDGEQQQRVDLEPDSKADMSIFHSLPFSAPRLSAPTLTTGCVPVSGPRVTLPKLCLEFDSFIQSQLASHD